MSDGDHGAGTVPRDPESFKQFFGMEISTFEWLCGLLEPLLDCRDPSPPLHLTAEVRLGIGVFRLATGADYPEISGRFCVSEAASRFCVKQLCRVLCTNFRFWVGFPSQTELESVSTQFETLTGLPNCCGIVNCARFFIGKGNSSENEAQQDSIAAQIVVDSSSRILSIIAGFRGSKTDSRILRSTSLFKDIENGVILNSRPLHMNDVCVPQYLVGNGEYPLLPFLLVPFLDPEAGSVEDNFNNVYRSLCVSSLNVVSSLRKWGVLSGTIEEEYKVVVAYIGACSILHNMLLAREDYSTFAEELDEGDLNFQHSARVGVNLMEEEALGIRQELARRARK